MRIIGRSTALAALPLMIVGLAGVARAQEVVLHQPDEIRGCLCGDQSLTALSADVEQRRRVYEERRKALEALDNRVASQRTQIDVLKESEVEAFKQLLVERDQAAADFAGETTRRYADAVARYNQAVASFNASCSGKAYDADVLAEVRTNLSCPKP